MAHPEISVGEEGGDRGRGEKSQAASDKVELRGLGSTFRFDDSIWKSG